LEVLTSLFLSARWESQEGRPRSLPGDMGCSSLRGDELDGRLLMENGEPIALRGIVNATSNFILSAMMKGRSYEDALAAADAAGLAERGVEADIDGSDAMAKIMILAGLVFGRTAAP
jgi:Homoserine dehydrogenase